MKLKNGYKEDVSIGRAILDMEEFYNEDTSANYLLVIGTDSQVKKRKLTYVSVLCLINEDTKKLRMFHSRESSKLKYKISIIERMIQEVMKSVHLLEEVENSTLVEKIGKNSLQIHIDVGYNGDSKKAIPTCMGIAKGKGVDVRIKPDSFIASAVADHLTK